MDPKTVMFIQMQIRFIHETIKSKLNSLPEQDPPFEEAFKALNYDRLEQLLQRKYRCLTMLYRSMLDLVKTDSSNLTKSDECSDMMRNNTNEKFVASADRGKMLSSMYGYDMAIAYAKTSERKAKAYGNVSAVYFRLNLIPQALVSIESALKHIDKTDHTLISKLQERKLICQNRIVVSDQDLAQLSYPSHSTVSGLAGILKLGKKSIITEKPLKCGDIIAMTKSFCFSHDMVLRRQFCNQCGDRTSGVKLPCDVCSTSLFCGEACKVKAMKGLHGLECDFVMGFLNSIDADPVKYLALKFAFKAMSIENYEHFEASPKGFTAFDWKKGDEDNDGVIMKTILSMKTKALSFKEMLTLTTYFVTLIEKTKHKKLYQSFIKRFDDGEKKLFNMFCRAYLVVDRNCFNDDFTLNIDWFSGILQHSCKPNLIIIRDSRIGTNNYVVIDDVAVGEELTIAFR